MKPLTTDEAASTTRLIELSRSECLELLAGSSVGRVVVTIGSGAVPVIRPVNYAFDAVSQSVVLRTTPGTKLYALLHSARAWFEVDAIDPESCSGWSVIIEGTTEPVSHPTEVRRLDGLGLHSWVAPRQAQWIRIHARTVSGRRIEATRRTD